MIDIGKKATAANVLGEGVNTNIKTAMDFFNGMG